jgi:vanillate O-demethylase monooxygenase subunit
MTTIDDDPVLEPDRVGLDALAMRAWHPVAVAAEVGDEPVRVTLMGRPVVVVRSPDGVRAYTDLCVHRGAAIGLGFRDGDCIRCPFHGWGYDPATGRCVDIPSQRGRPIPERARLVGHHVAEHLGLVWVALDEPVVGLPQFPMYDDARFRTVVCPPYDWSCHASRRVENFLDFAHFAWVHPGTLGDRDHPEVPEHETWLEGDVLAIRQPRPEPRNDVKTAGLDDTLDHTDDGRVITMMHYRGYPPFAAYLHQVLPGGREYAVMLIASPIDDHTTRTFWHVARTYDLDAPDERFVQFQVDVVAQDRAIVESQRPEQIPAAITAELHVHDDKVSLLWRRVLHRLIART